MRKIYVCGAKPFISYGGKVNGFSNTETVQVRRAFAAIESPRVRCASLQAKCALHNDPASELVTATAGQLSRMLLESCDSTQHCRHHGGGAVQRLAGLQTTLLLSGEGG